MSRTKVHADARRIFPVLEGVLYRIASDLWAWQRAREPPEQSCVLSCGWAVPPVGARATVRPRELGYTCLCIARLSSLSWKLPDASLRRSKAVAVHSRPKLY